MNTLPKIRLCRFYRFCRERGTILAAWIASGCICGAVTAACVSDSFLLLMRSDLFHRTSIVWSVTVAFLPFLISAAAAWLMKYWVFYPLGFSMGFQLAFLAVVIIQIFGSSGWLVCGLFLFSRIWSLPLLCWFWIRRFSGDGASLKHDCFICFLLAAAICLLDHMVLSPLLVAVLDT